MRKPFKKEVKVVTERDTTDFTTDYATDFTDFTIFIVEIIMGKPFLIQDLTLVGTPLVDLILL